MKLGLIGHPLGHSWSPQIHKLLIGADYSKWDLLPEELPSFMTQKDFSGINVTIPYKQDVIPYLNSLDETALKIGAVNCIVHRDDELVGYNTDCIGFMNMLIANGIDVENQNVALLGSGGASKAVKFALKKLKAKVSVVSRKQKEGCITYETLYEQANQYTCIVNATPVGMYPNTNQMPIDIEPFTSCKTVVDIIANPLRTKLLFEAKLRGMKTLGGFEMLVRQAFAADELFLNRKLDESLNQACMKKLYYAKRNVVLIGMPTSGKTTIAQELGKQLNKQVVEMDDEIEKILQTSISECFATKGESYFREKEKEVAQQLQHTKGCIISCGGGVIKNKETMAALCENGIVIWIKRDLESLFSSASRPLTGDETYMKNLYEERKGLYAQYCDCMIDNNQTIEDACQQIKKIIGEN